MEKFFKFVLISIFIFWFLLGTFFYYKMARPLTQASILKDGYKQSLISNPHNEEYQKQAYSLYRDYEKQLAYDEDEVVSYFYSKTRNERAAILLVVSVPFLVIVSYIIIFIDKKMQKSKNKKYKIEENS